MKAIGENGWAALEKFPLPDGSDPLYWLHCFATTKSGVWDRLLALHRSIDAIQNPISPPLTRRQLQKKLTGIKLVRAHVALELPDSEE